MKMTRNVETALPGLCKGQETAVAEPHATLRRKIRFDLFDLLINKIT